MKKIKFLFSAIMYLAAIAFFTGCDQQSKNEKVTVRAYNPDLVQAELSYLNTLDPKQLSNQESKERTTRVTELTDLSSKMKDNGALNGFIYESIFARVPVLPPPTPCPIDKGCLVLNIDIKQFELGILSEVMQEATATIQIDEKNIFATGQLKTPRDILFKTARFNFTVNDKNLAGKAMTLFVKTSFNNGQQLQPIELAIPLEPNTFIVN